MGAENSGSPFNIFPAASCAIKNRTTRLRYLIRVSIRVISGWVGLTSFEANQGYLRRTIEPHRHTAYACAWRGVSLHPAQVPQSVVELFPLELMADQRHSLFEADLSAMGVATEIKIISVCRCRLGQKSHETVPGQRSSPRNRQPEADSCAGSRASSGNCAAVPSPKTIRVAVANSNRIPLTIPASGTC